jgi:hypothetical protein
MLRCTPHAALPLLMLRVLQQYYDHTAATRAAFGTTAVVTFATSATAISAAATINKVTGAATAAAATHILPHYHCMLK